MYGSKSDEELELGSEEHYVDADLYDYEYRRRRDDVHFYASLARGELAPQSNVLELCCGTGRVTRELLRSGFHVTGVDLSTHMLAKAKTRAEGLAIRFRDNATFHKADIRDFHLGEKFPMVVMAFNSFEHLYNREDVEACLRCVREHLEPDGLFAFDLQLPDLRWLIKDPRKKWSRIKFRHPVSRQWLAYSTNHVYEPVTQTARIRLYYEPLEEGPIQDTMVVKLSQRKYYPAELEALLHYSGFRLERHYGDFEGEDLDEFAENQVLLCRPS